MIIREIAISIYLFLFRLIFLACKLAPIQKKVTFVTSFVDNTAYIYEELKRQKIDIEIVFLYNPRCRPYFANVDELTIPFETMNIFQTVRGIYHLATSEKVIVDNYYGFLAAITFKKQVQCVQIWHAAGAVKQFGLKDPSNANRSKGAIKRFKKVYKKFDKITVGSDFFSDIFKQAFLVSDENILPTGIPRTDFFFQEAEMERARALLIEKNPIFAHKKVILYAPTFRKDDLIDTTIPSDIELMYQHLREDYVLVIRLHPTVSLLKNIEFVERYAGFMYDYSSYPSVNELLTITDTLISDYSSIPMEFSLLKGKTIFYAYDYEEYEKNSGFWENYHEAMSGVVVTNTEDIITEIFQPLDEERILTFSKKWNEYSTGKSSEQFVTAIFGGGTSHG